jgi:VIT1/CCC1 family predicted Fe2+/Mn2+ transporter
LEPGWPALVAGAFSMGTGEYISVTNQNEPVHAEVTLESEMLSLGALIPLLPYLAGLPMLAATLVITAVALVTGGMFVGHLTGRPVVRSGIRQLALGGLAIAVTYGVGSLIGSHGTH